MRIAYLILTCEKYKHTRRVWQRETWLRQVNPTDYFYMTATPDPTDSNTTGWGAPDDYISLPLKYYHFIKNMPLNDYDWIVFCDDDTFIFPKRLHSYLSKKSLSDPLYIGRRINFVPIELDTGYRFERPMNYMSGGAGFILSRAAYAIARQQILDDAPLGIDRENLLPHLQGMPPHADAYIGALLEPFPVKHVELPYLNYNCSTDMHPIEDAMSFHYVTEDLYREYGAHLDAADNYDSNNQTPL